MIKVLVVEDSAVGREFLVTLLNADPVFTVIGTASNGEEAIEIVKRKRPDIITMDSTMPRMDGFETTRRIMETYPTPVVMVSGGWGTHEVATTFRAVEAGALAVVPRPPGIGHPEHKTMAQELIQTVKLMSEVKVVRRWAHLQRKTAAPSAPPAPDVVQPRSVEKIQLVAIGASTGGPAVLQTILSRLSADFLVPVVIVQHMAAGFIAGFVDWLEQATCWPVHVAANREILLPRHAYLAPDGLQMKVEAGGKVALIQDEPENGLCPSVSYLFRSVAAVYGSQAVGVLLTGMGKDGAKELKLLRDKGAVTLVQDKESSIVHGMPGEAVKLDAATYVLPPERIATVLATIVNGK
jgi:two-component system chemotaxis response regulator CheB